MFRVYKCEAKKQLLATDSQAVADGQGGVWTSLGGDTPDFAVAMQRAQAVAAGAEYEGYTVCGGYVVAAPVEPEE